MGMELALALGIAALTIGGAVGGAAAAGAFKGDKEAGGSNTDDADNTISGSEASAKKLRSALYATAGGSSGSELVPGEIKRRETLLGN